MEHTDFVNVCQSIAAELSVLTPGDWEVRTTGYCITMVETTTKLSLYLSNGGYQLKDRISISHDRPRHRDGSYVELWEKNSSGKIVTPSIKVTETKSPTQIAKDIVRRLLPEAQRVEQLAVEAIRAQIAYEDKKTGLREQVGAMFGGIPHHCSPNEADPYNLIKTKYTRGYGKVEVNSDSMNIELKSVPATLGLRILAEVRRLIEADAKAIG